MIFSHSIFAYTSHVCSCEVFLNWVISSTCNVVTICSRLLCLMTTASTAYCFLLVLLRVFVQFCVLWPPCYFLYVTDSDSWRDTDGECLKSSVKLTFYSVSCQCISSYGCKKLVTGVLENLKIASELHILYTLWFQITKESFNTYWQNKHSTHKI